MAKNLFIVVATFYVFSLQPVFAQAAESVPADFAKPCEQQQLTIQALEHNREKMAHEIQRLHEENRQLNETLNKIRSQIGNGHPAPNTYR